MRIAILRRSWSFDVHPTSLPLDQLLGECREIRTRRSGPGGQHRNKVETAVVLTHQGSGISAEASERRSQDANRKVALERLRRRLALKIRGRFSGTPSARWQSRASGRRLSVSETHLDFAPLLAEALDALTALNWDVGATAEALEVSPSQLTKFIARDAEAFVLLNSERQQRGLRPLR
ncbi:MAG: peptide chain release factor-like protein [Planctomycetales bacterium]|nr:peptide chain release factor-like protein [Planctomycetales bacterium]